MCICRQTAYRNFCDAWERASGFGVEVNATSIDQELRSKSLSQKYTTTLSDLPDGCFFVLPNARKVANLIWQRKFFKWHAGSYSQVASFDPAMEVLVLTPKPLVATLSAGYEPYVALP
jgi:hypothetical protein